jgi:hypothetical protein
MVNDLTSFAADIHWLRDGGDTGYQHARTNIAEVLGALQFLPGWTCQRWNNRWHENDPTNDELTKFYCRSAMPGVWGISEDLSKVDTRQLAVIRQEVKHYRKLNQLKASGVWDIHYPHDEADIAAITFYGEDRSRAAVLVYRWKTEGAVQTTIALTGLAGENYHIQDVDTGFKIDLNRNKELSLHLDNEQLSALCFIETGQ